MDSVLQAPPHSLEAEQAVLGGVILDNAAWDLIADRLTENDFYIGEHRVIFSLISDLSEQKRPFDAVTLSELAVKKRVSDNLLSYLGQLCLSVPSTANIVAYRDIVQERSALRTLISLGHHFTRIATAPDADSKAVHEEIESKLFSLGSGGGDADNFASIPDLLTELFEDVEKNANNPDGLLGVDTGLTDLNSITAGFQDSDLIVLAARPSMGKTALSLRFAAAALQAGKTVQYFSLEMPSKGIVSRLVCMLGKVSLHKLRKSDLDQDEWTRVSQAANKLNEVSDKLIIDDQASLTPVQLRAKSRRAARRYGTPGLILVDYLQLMRSSKSKVENRNLEIGEISASLKALAKEMNCPVVALSQLNRGVEHRTDKRPNNGDLRESGAIEQDADMIMFIYRDEVYHPETTDLGVAEIIIGKNRNGPTGVARCAWIGEQTNFADLAPSHYRYAEVSA